MRTLLSALRATAAVVLMAGAVIPASAQGDEQRLAEAKAQTASYLRYFKFESKFSQKEIDRLAELRVKIHSPSTSLEDRQAALKEFLTMLFRAAGTNPPPPEQALENFAKNNGQAAHRLVSDPGAKPSGGSTPLGNLGSGMRVSSPSSSVPVSGDLRFRSPPASEGRRAWRRFPRRAPASSPGSWRRFPFRASSALRFRASFWSSTGWLGFAAGSGCS